MKPQTPPGRQQPVMPATVGQSGSCTPGQSNLRGCSTGRRLDTRPPAGARCSPACRGSVRRHPPGRSQRPSALGRPLLTPMTKPRPNDPCPCGSGRKYKRCCGDPSKPAARTGGPNGDEQAPEPEAAALVPSRPSEPKPREPEPYSWPPLDASRIPPRLLQPNEARRLLPLPHRRVVAHLAELVDMQSEASAREGLQLLDMIPDDDIKAVWPLVEFRLTLLADAGERDKYWTEMLRYMTGRRDERSWSSKRWSWWRAGCRACRACPMRARSRKYAARSATCWQPTAVMRRRPCTTSARHVSSPGRRTAPGWRTRCSRAGDRTRRRPRCRWPCRSGRMTRTC